jgi:hypothetical protein
LVQHLEGRGERERDEGRGTYELKSGLHEKRHRCKTRKIYKPDPKMVVLWSFFFPNTNRTSGILSVLLLINSSTREHEALKGKYFTTGGG